MRLPLKYKIILAPAAVLLLLTLLLGFLQFTYWDLSVKRQSADRLKLAFIALAEADLLGKQMHAFATSVHPGQVEEYDSRRLEEMNELYVRLSGALQKIGEILALDGPTLKGLKQLQEKLDPRLGVDGERYRTTVIELRSQLNTLSETVQKERETLQRQHNQDITELVARTTAISMIVLISAILIGIVISLTFSRQIVGRIWELSTSAGRIARGELIPLSAPKTSQDELDDLAISLSRMTDRLIRVVGTEKLLEGAEEERRRIARDIHDQTLADLSGILRDLENLHCGGCEQGARRLEDDLRRAMTNLREVMDDLHPQTLDILGLAAALESFLERSMTREGLPEYHLYASPATESLPLSRQAQLAVYRIALEAIHNVVRHARASRYEVVLERRGDELVLSIEDNGSGFTPSATSNGRGMNNMRERARAIGAEISWGPSRFSSGTRVELTYNIAG